MAESSNDSTSLRSSVGLDLRSAISAKIRSSAAAASRFALAPGLQGPTSFSNHGKKSTTEVRGVAVMLTLRLNNGSSAW